MLGLVEEFLSQRFGGRVGVAASVCRRDGAGARQAWPVVRGWRRTMHPEGTVRYAQKYGRVEAENASPISPMDSVARGRSHRYLQPPLKTPTAKASVKFSNCGTEFIICHNQNERTNHSSSNPADEQQ